MPRSWALNGITFSTAEGATALNLFRTGDVDSMEGIALPFQLASRMTKARDITGLPVARVTVGDSTLCGRPSRTCCCGMR